MKYKVGVVGFAALFASFFAFCGCKENCAKKIFFAGATQNAKVSPKADGAISDKFIFPAEGAVKFDGMLGKSLDTAMNGDILVWNTDELLRPYRERYEKKTHRLAVGIRGQMARRRGACVRLRAHGKAR